MKTSVELDEKKIALAKKLSHSSTLRELLDKALDSFISQARRQAMSEMLGTDFFDGDLSKMRERRGRSPR